MKRYLKFIAAAFAAFTLTAVLVNATVAEVEKETITVSSKSSPALNCTISMSQAESIFNLLPQEIRNKCKSEYSRLNPKCKKTQNFKYQGVSICSSGNDDLVNLTFSYGGYELKVNNTTWSHLDQMFR